MSDNNFKNYSYYQVNNGFQENNDEFHLRLNKLTPGDYSYAIVLRDYSNKTEVIYQEDFTFSVPTPLTEYILVVILIMIIGLVGFSFYIVYVGIKNYSIKSRTLG